MAKKNKSTESKINKGLAHGCSRPWEEVYFSSLQFSSREAVEVVGERLPSK